MTVVRDSHGVVRAAGHVGWPLLPSQPEEGWPLVPSAEPAEPVAEPTPLVRCADPAAALPVDDLVAVAAALNDGPGRIVYVDRRPDRAA